jgi:hypothetical protein
MLCVLSILFQAVMPPLQISVSAVHFQLALQGGLVLTLLQHSALSVLAVAAITTGDIM